MNKHPSEDADDRQPPGDGKLRNAKVFNHFRPSHELAALTVSTLTQGLHAGDQPAAMSAGIAGWWCPLVHRRKHSGDRGSCPQLPVRSGLDPFPERAQISKRTPCINSNNMENYLMATG